MMNRKRVLSVAMAVVLLITTAFYYAPKTFAQSQVASETDAEKETSTPETEIAFDHCYNDAAQVQMEDEGLDFSSCELFVKANAEIFTPATTIQEVSDGTYILKFASEEETRSAYTYYYDKAQSIEANVDCFEISLSLEEKKLSILIADHDKKVSDVYAAIKDAIQGAVENIYVSEGIAGQSKFIDAALQCALDAGITVTSRNQEVLDTGVAEAENEKTEEITQATTEAIQEETTTEEIKPEIPEEVKASQSDANEEEMTKSKWNVKEMIMGILQSARATGSCAGYVSQQLGLSYMPTISQLYPYLLAHGYRVVGQSGAYNTATQDGCNELSSAVNKIARPGDIIVFYDSPVWGSNDHQTHVGIINQVGGMGERESGTNLYTFPTYNYDSTDNKGVRTNYSIGRWVYYAKSDGKSSNSFEIISKEVALEEKGELKLQKSSSMPEVTNGNSCYSLEGAVYNVYSGNTASGTPVATLTTDATGAATISNLNVGTYTIKEVKPPKGYALDTTEYHVTTSKSVVTRVDVTDRPKMDPVNILLEKENVKGIGIADARYTIKYYKGVKMDTDPAVSQISVDRMWTFKTDAEGKIRFSNNTKWFVGGDAFYLNAFNAASLPEGTITIQEVSAPTGYVLDPTVYVRQITPGEDASVSAYNAPTIIEQISRGDLAIKKKNDSGEPLANIKFLLTNTETRENHVIWTDNNGYYSTASSYIPHDLNTNNGEAGDGVWFGDEPVDNARGALPYGTYMLQELRCAANKDKYKGIEPITFTITEDQQVYELGDIINYEFPTITTKVMDTETKTNIASASEHFAGIDIVSLGNLELQHEYTVTMKAYSQYLGDFVDTDTKSFTATDTEMDVNMDIGFEVVDGIEGTDVTIFEYLTDSAYPDEQIAIEEDLNNESQTIHFPKVETTFTDDVTGDHIAIADKVVHHTDKVDYKNLLVGKPYKTVSELYFTDNGETVKDADGNAIMHEVEFIPDTPDGTVDVTFEFDASLIAGRAIVAFETIYLDGKKVATHADLTDEGQTIHYPKVGTTFTDDVTGDHIAIADKVVHHTDKVDYKNLLVGKSYKTVSELYFTDNGETVKDADGNTITQEVEFTPDTSDGTVDVTFEFDASLIAGRAIVAFETIYLDGKKVAAHADLTDERQTIHYPEIHTTAKDAVSLTHDGRRRHEAVIIDTVDSKNLITGAKYRVDGTIYDYDTQSPFLKEGGEQVRASVEFTAEKSDSSVEVTFPEINTIKLFGKSLVCYERLYLIIDDKEYLVAVHEDIEDKDQTVTYDHFVGYIDMHINLQTGGQGQKAVKKPKTGDTMKLFMFLGTALVSGSVAGFMIYRKKKGDKRHED